MKAKGKFIIAISAFGVIIVGLVVALVAVLASFNATAENGLKVSYTATNVCATVTASYVIVDDLSQLPAQESGYNTIITSNGASSIIFDSNDSAESVTKNFDDIPEIELGKDQVFHFIYSITNNEAGNNAYANINPTLTTSFSKNSNIKIEYKIINWDEDWTTTLSPFTIKANEQFFIRVRIYVETKTQDANLDGTFNWTLSEADTIYENPYSGGSGANGEVT